MPTLFVKSPRTLAVTVWRPIPFSSKCMVSGNKRPGKKNFERILKGYSKIGFLFSLFEPSKILLNLKDFERLVRSGNHGFAGFWFYSGNPSKIACFIATIKLNFFQNPSKILLFPFQKTSKFISKCKMEIEVFMKDIDRFLKRNSKGFRRGFVWFF